VSKPILGVPHFGSVGHLPTKNADRVRNPVSVEYLLTKAMISIRTNHQYQFQAMVRVLTNAIKLSNWAFIGPDQIAY